MTASATYYEYEVNEILTGAYPALPVMIVLAAGQNLPEGALIGKITASGKYVLSLAAATDGSEVPVAITSTPIDASSADEKGVAYVSGQFVTRHLTFGTGHTVASVKDGLRDLNIYLD